MRRRTSQVPSFLITGLTYFFSGLADFSLEEEWFLSHTSPVEVPQEVPTAWDGVNAENFHVLFETSKRWREVLSLPRTENVSLKKMHSPKFPIFPELIQNSSFFLDSINFDTSLDKIEGFTCTCTEHVNRWDLLYDFKSCKMTIVPKGGE